MRAHNYADFTCKSKDTIRLKVSLCKSETSFKYIIYKYSTKGIKCPRCWKILESACKRCEVVLKGKQI